MLPLNCLSAASRGSSESAILEHSARHYQRHRYSCSFARNLGGVCSGASLIMNLVSVVVAMRGVATLTRRHSVGVSSSAQGERLSVRRSREPTLRVRRMMPFEDCLLTLQIIHGPSPQKLLHPLLNEPPMSECRCFKDTQRWFWHCLSVADEKMSWSECWHILRVVRKRLKRSCLRW